MNFHKRKDAITGKIEKMEIGHICPKFMMMIVNLSINETTYKKHVFM